MENNISSIAELREAIQILEMEQDEHLYQMKEKFGNIVESLRPVNLIGNSIKGIVSSPNLGNNVLTVGVGLVTGYLSRKAMLLGGSNSKFGRIFGHILQLGVTGLVARSPKAVKSAKEFITQRIFRKKVEIG